VRTPLLSTGLCLLALCGCFGENGGSGAQRSSQQHESWAEVGEGSRLVVTVGDSITAGTPLWDPDPSVRQRIGPDADPRHQWQHWAALANPELRFRNCGVNRERTDQIAARVERCLGSAKLLVVQGGINDLAQGRSIDHAERGLRTMVRTGLDAGATVLIAEVLPWNAGYPQYDRPIRQLNGRIAAMAREYGGDVLPFYGALEDPARPGRMRASYTQDGSHPSLAGHRRLGEWAFRLDS
jgi:lysophospholipase L1-like esterase